MSTYLIVTVYISVDDPFKGGTVAARIGNDRYIHIEMVASYECDPARAATECRDDEWTPSGNAGDVIYDVVIKHTSEETAHRYSCIQDLTNIDQDVPPANNDDPVHIMMIEHITDDGSIKVDIVTTQDHEKYLYEAVTSNRINLISWWVYRKDSNGIGRCHHMRRVPLIVSRSYTDTDRTYFKMKMTPFVTSRNMYLKDVTVSTNPIDAIKGIYGNGKIVTTLEGSEYAIDAPNPSSLR
ncbi:hypothetical protein HDU85_005922 [Gaertneriomyces sp. JEL0708]|nr:hypothetical protein HDU85_005922 [Gaertneriomyces sp. JEL0708]